MVQVRGKKRRFGAGNGKKAQFTKQKDKQLKKVVVANLAETKLLNNQFLFNIPAVGQVNYMSTIAQGDDNFQRDGNTIANVSVEWRYSLTSALVADDIVRIIVFQDSQNVAVLPTVVEVLQGATPEAQYNIPNRLQNRFRIIYDRMHARTQVSDSENQVHRTFSKKVAGIHFTGIANVIGSAGKNALFMLAVSSANVTTGVTFDYTIKYNP